MGMWRKMGSYHLIDSKYLLFSQPVEDGYLDEILECYDCCGELELVTWVGTLEVTKVFIVQDGKVMRVGMEK